MGVNKNFVVKNGFEVNTDLILADADNNKVGIGTSVPTTLLHVNGGIAATHVNVSGVTTVNTLVLDGAVTIGNTYGRSNQFLVSNGSGGVSWGDLPELRVSASFEATADQTVFAFTETVGYLDVFVNGVKLASSNYVYTPGVQVSLVNPAFAEDEVELVGYSAQSLGFGAGGLDGISVYQDGIIKGSVGLVSAINFVDQIIGVNSTGYAVTVYGGGGGTVWKENPTGLSTNTSVGIGTTNATSTLTVDGDGSFAEGLVVSGITTLGITTVGSSSTVRSLYVQGGATASGVVTAAYFEGDGSRISGIVAAAIDTGWIDSAVGLGTTAKVGIGTTIPTAQLQVGRVGYNLDQNNLLVYGGANISGNVTIGSSVNTTFATLGSLTIETSNIDVDDTSDGLISIGGTAVRILGDLYVDGTQVTTSSTNIDVETKIVGIASTSTASNVSSDGGGIILYGDTNKEFLWNLIQNSWTSNVNLNLTGGSTYKIDGIERLSYGMLTVPNATIAGVVTTGSISAGGNISASTFSGNGNALSGIVTSIIAGNNISITGSTGQITIAASGVGTGGGGGNGASVTISDSAPSSPFSGDLWYDSDFGRGFIYYVDGDSSQWVDFSPNGGTPSNSITVENNGTPLPQAISTLNFTGNVSISTSISGISTIGINTNITAVYTDVAGISTYASTAGISTYASTAGIATYASTVGIATYASTAGIATYAETVGVSTYSATAGIATYATTAGVSTAAQGLSGTPNLNVGIVTASNFVGDGSGLTGVTIGVKDSGSTVGTATTVDFGSNLSVSPVVSGIVTITAAAGSSYADSDVDTHLNQSTAGSGEVLSWSGSDYEWVAQSGGGGIALTDLSVTQNSAGTAALSYNNSTGVFLYTPPNLSSYLTSVNQNFTGIVTATSFQGNSTTGDGSDRGFTTKYYITADGSTSYRFAGPGVLNTTNDPTLYFHRGFTYILENSTGGSHPFALRVSAGGADYAPGGSFLTGSQTGTQILTVPFDAPSSIVYQCTIHTADMVGTINFVS